MSVWPRCTNATSDLKAPTYGDEVLALSSDLKAPNDLGCGIFVGRAFRSDAMFAKHLSKMHR